jgi:uncharacterized protein Yka (UPF0111/DUF47 family)
MKAKAVAMLGETSLQLPAALAAALAANDHVKELLSQAQAEPGRLTELLPSMLAAVATMLAPLPDQAALADRFAALRDRLAAQPRLDGVTAADRGRGDSLHLLVMDAHRALNRLQQTLAEGAIDGAAVYGLAAGDDRLVRAFMTGLNRTAPLKFDHPGLGTTATRAGERLLIQNDIGTTDAHIIVVQVDAAAVRLTYSDVHLERLAFFRSLFPDEFGGWSEAKIGEDRELAGSQPFFLTVAEFPAADDGRRCQLLEAIGARLVYLIDWNKARKRLHLFLDNERAVQLLGWAARENVGHRAFLQLGGERLVYDAVEAASGGQVRYGETLADMLGGERCFDFLKFLLKACALGLLEGRSQSLIRDQIRAELLSHFNSREQQMLDLAGDHGGYILEIADLVRASLADWQGDNGDRAARAKSRERAADEALMALRGRAHGKPEALLLCRIVETADDAADDLEEAAYLISLGGASPPGEAVLDRLQRLAALLVEDAREWVKLLANAGRLYHLTDRQQRDDFLVAADALARIERETDHAERSVTAALVAAPPPVADFHLAAAIAQALEQAADSLMRAGFQLHDHMLSRLGPN